MTTVRTLWHHRGPCSMKNLLRAALERPSIMANISPVSPLRMTVTYRWRLRIEVSSISNTRQDCLPRCV